MPTVIKKTTLAGNLGARVGVAVSKCQMTKPAGKWRPAFRTRLKATCETPHIITHAQYNVRLALPLKRQAAAESRATAALAKAAAAQAARSGPCQGASCAGDDWSPEPGSRAMDGLEGLGRHSKRRSSKRRSSKRHGKRRSSKRR